MIIFFSVLLFHCFIFIFFLSSFVSLLHFLSFLLFLFLTFLNFFSFLCGVGALGGRACNTLDDEYFLSLNVITLIVVLAISLLQPVRPKSSYAYIPGQIKN